MLTDCRSRVNRDRDFDFFLFSDTSRLLSLLFFTVRASTVAVSLISGIFIESSSFHMFCASSTIILKLDPPAGSSVTGLDCGSSSFSQLKVSNLSALSI